MDRNTVFQGLRFEQRARSLPRRPLIMGGTLTLFTLLWWFVPPSTLYWLLLVGIAIMVWIASFGWRQAIAALHALLHRLEQA